MGRLRPEAQEDPGRTGGSGNRQLHADVEGVENVGASILSGSTSQAQKFLLTLPFPSWPFIARQVMDFGHSSEFTESNWADIAIWRAANARLDSRQAHTAQMT